jgi:hypothetical protein
MLWDGDKGEAHVPGYVANLNRFLYLLMKGLGTVRHEGTKVKAKLHGCS